MNTITLIDDDPICHLISSRMINIFSSLEVESFTDPVKALDTLQQRAGLEPPKLPDVILLDIDMPGMNGWQFLDAFERLPSDVLQKTAVMMLSSSYHSEDIETSKRYKTVKHFFSKPLTEEKVRLIVGLNNH
ncbi:MAG TPA: response regulator [Ohtaekwangia sp.]|nr:response regulator [Ohtaekwangia sp.]